METIRNLYSKIKTLWSFDTVIFGQEFNLGSQKVLIHIPAHLMLGTLAYYIGLIFGYPITVWLTSSLTLLLSQVFWENIMEKDGKRYYGIAENIFDFVQYLIVPIIILTVK